MPKTAEMYNPFNQLIKKKNQKIFKLPYCDESS